MNGESGLHDGPATPGGHPGAARAWGMSGGAHPGVCGVLIWGLVFPYFHEGFPYLPLSPPLRTLVHPTRGNGRSSGQGWGS